jgi:hypothetical protein
MASITGGVPLGGFISPTDSADNFPVTNPTYGLGGLRNVADITARNAIPAGRREQGMMVFVESESEYYSLSGGIANTDWVVFSSGSGSGNTGPQGTTGNTGNTGPQGTAGQGSTVAGPQGNTGNTGNTGGAVDLSFTGGAPAGASAGDLWFDSTAGVFSVYIDDGDSNQWVELAGKQGNNEEMLVSRWTYWCNRSRILPQLDGGVTAGAGTNTCNGSTLGIDSTAVVHVAGISSDGGMLLLMVIYTQIGSMVVTT